MIRAEILLQELWPYKTGWDDALPSQLNDRWLVIKQDLSVLSQITIPRWFNTLASSKVEIHGFADASQLAMGAVVYLVVISQSSDSLLSLVGSKTRVAPLKAFTIPKLELTAALLLTKLTSNVQATLKMDVSATHLWTDSLDTLAWVSSHSSRWKDYVRNRVRSIQETLPLAVWRHVPGKENPVDCVSRGISTAQLKSHPLWWTGPSWMVQEQSHWLLNLPTARRHSRQRFGQECPYW